MRFLQVEPRDDEPAPAKAPDEAAPARDPDAEQPAKEPDEPAKESDEPAKAPDGDSEDIFPGASANPISQLPRFDTQSTPIASNPIQYRHDLSPE